MKKSKKWKIEIMESSIAEPTEEEEKEIKVENDPGFVPFVHSGTVLMTVFDEFFLSS